MKWVPLILILLGSAGVTYSIWADKHAGLAELPGIVIGMLGGAGAIAIGVLWLIIESFLR